MKFYEALKEVVENGKKARRQGWMEDEYIYFQDGLIFGETGEPYDPANASLAAEDWEIVKEKVKKTRTLWINLYPDGNLQPRVVGYLTKADADAGAYYNRILCKEVTFEWEEEVCL